MIDAAPTPGLVLAAPRSGGGKTTVTLALLAALREAGTALAPAKVGPDYIDPGYHAAAARAPCLNLDPWAMDASQLRALATPHAAGRDMMAVEGVMGLFDGARQPGAFAAHRGDAFGGHGSTADVARALDLPVVLILDASGQAQSVAAVAKGFAALDSSVRVAGVILNKLASARHEAMLRDALGTISMPCLGAMPRDERLSRPSRHLGLVQAEEGELEAFLSHAAGVASASLDLDGLRKIAAPIAAPLHPAPTTGPALPPPGQRVAVARDAAFRFAYTHMLDGWSQAGAAILPFSPLADEAPDASADAVFLPGGYPELHAGRLAANGQFQSGVRAAAERGALVYGECGGYMALGQGLTDGEGVRHAMLGLLDLETSFAAPKRHLGYRLAEIEPGAPWLAGRRVRGHEFHYCATTQERGDRWMRVIGDGSGLGEPGDAGLRAGRVCGGFVHLIA